MTANVSKRGRGWIALTLMAGLLACPVAAHAALPDDAGPKVTLVAPRASSPFGTVPWSASVGDPSGVGRVEFLVDGRIVETDRSAPYGGLWDTTRYYNGTHQIAARAFDVPGNSTLTQRTVDVANVLGPPASYPGGFGVVGTDLVRSFGLDQQIREQSRSWSAYAGGDSPESAFLGWMLPGVATLPATITLPQAVPPGRHSFFVKGYNYGSRISVRFSIGGGVASVATNDRDGNGTWSVSASLTTLVASNKLTLTLQKNDPLSDSAKYLLRGLYITDNADETVLKYDTVVDLKYPTTMDDSPPQPGNLIENSSFETGMGHGWGLSENRQFGLWSIWDNRQGYDGSASVKLPLSPRTRSYGSYVSLLSKVYSVVPNKKYTLSAWVKTDPGATAEGSLSLVNAFSDNQLLPSGAPPQYKIGQSFSVGSSWTRVSVTGYLLDYPTADYQVDIAGRQNPGHSLWVDGVSLTQGGPAGYAPKLPLEVGLRSAQPGNLYYEDQPVVFRLRAANRSPTYQAGTVRYEAYDYMNRMVKSGSVSVSAPALTNTARDLDLGTGERGSFRVVLWIAGREGSEEEVLFGVVPHPQVAGPDPQSSMGIDSNFTDFQYALLQRLGIKWDRAMSPGPFFRWSLVEPVEGQITWYDAKVDTARRWGIQIMGTIGEGGWPAWADAGGKPDLAKWQAFVGRLADHYRGRVRAWEVWNEPNSTFQPDFYARMVKLAAEAIRQADPNARVVAMGGSGIPQYITSVITELERQYPQWPWRNYLDVLSVHMYPPTELASPWADPAPAPDFRQRVVSVYNKPVWNTEGGFWDSGFFHGSNAPSVLWGRSLFPFQTGYPYTESSPLAVENVAINFIETIGNGISKYFYYDFRPAPSPDLFQHHPSALEYDDTVRPKGIVLSVLAKLFDHSNGLGPLATRDDYSRALLFDRGGTPLIALYTTDNASRSVTLSGLAQQQIKVYDVMGNPLAVTGTTVPFGRQPVYVEGQGITVAALRTAFEQGMIQNRPDTVAPNLTINRGPRGTVPSTAAVLFRWGAADDTYTPGAFEQDAITYSYRVDGSSWSPWSASSYVDLPGLSKGPHLFDVKARDAAGNATPVVSRSFSVG
jgi:hypothetical protein